MINGISGISSIAYTPSDLPQLNNFLHFFNQAITMGYDPAEAKKWATKKVKEQKEEKAKKRKIKDTDKSSDQQKHIIDRRA